MKALTLARGLRPAVRSSAWPGVGLAGCLILALYAPVVPGLVADWWTHAEYSHGFAIPFVSAYLAWGRRRALADAPIRGSLAGFAVLGMGAALYVLGAWAFEPFLMQVSLPVVLAGAIWGTFGAAVIRHLAFPLAFLVFMIPLPYPIFKSLALGLRYLDAEIAAAALRTLGVPVLQDGYLLHLPRITLEVADGCSGLFSIVTLLAIGTLYAHLMVRGVWRRLLVVLAIIPVAVAVNIGRIVLIAWISYVSGDWIFWVTFKTFTGLFNFLLSGALLIALGHAVTRLGRRRVAA